MLLPVLSDDVARALADGRPVVALESTIFSNLGLPSPANAQALDRCLNAIRQGGAVPAVTAVLGIWALSAAMEGWLFGPLSWLARAFLAFLAIAILYPPQLSFLGLPGMWVTVGGALVIVAVHFARKFARRRALPEGG